ncbi:hypothetical protein [Bradyrhizobium acaciae]|uniref:hypothetical protein n=1 Tax=Bradyrhizobium acaciae TaxID=2683706 RepID=UPI001E43EB13|nr:hypothetical protein [Bradyrhizobium acaciae]
MSDHIWYRNGTAAAAAARAVVLRAALNPYLCLIISAACLGNNLISDSANMIDIAGFAVLGPLLGLMGDRLRRESEQARYRQAHLQSILDTVPEAMMVIDERAIIRSFSAAAVR